MCSFLVYIGEKGTFVCRRLGITVKLYESSDQNDGFCTVVDGKAVIFVNEKCPPSRQRFTAAHELGHLILGHVGMFVSSLSKSCAI